MNCSVPANQSIYQALIDKAASYPADQPYKAKAYKKAAESVAASKCNLYNSDESYPEMLPGIGYSIEDFIYDFISTNPEPAKPAEPITPANWSVQAMDDARIAAAAAAPKAVTTWPNDDAERAAFQQKLAASKVDESFKAAARSWANYLESMKPVVYTAENPRRSKRNIGKPTPKYFTEEDEQDEIAEAIEAVCAKKGYKFSMDLVTDFNAWLPTADKYSLEKYDYKTDKYIPRSKAEAAKEWAMYYSKSIEEQKKLKKLSKAIVKYCEKNGIEYQDVMAEKFAAWKADPANKKLVTYTYSSFSVCACGSCDPTGTKMASATEYSYDRSPAYCVKAWFSTLKKTIVW